MYGETIDTSNKIISTRDLQEIFDKMWEVFKKYYKLSEEEAKKNYGKAAYEESYSYRDENSTIKFYVDFYDSTQITFDSYEKFMAIFNSRITEIKSIDMYYTLRYSTKINGNYAYDHQTIRLYIRERKLDIDLDLKNDDPKLNEIYELIKEKILTAPERYDDVIIKKKSIINSVAFTKGVIPAIIISTLLLLVPFINNIIFKGYVVFPLIVILLSFTIGSMLSVNKMDKLYAPIVPDKKYAGYDENYKSIYKDDIDSFVGESEILIGKKIHNLDNREAIRKEYSNAKKKLPIYLIIILFSSIAVIIIGMFI